MLRCYCCGEELGSRFTLLSPAENTDRVFVMKTEHVEIMVPDASLVQEVQTTDSLTTRPKRK